MTATLSHAGEAVTTYRPQHPSNLHPGLSLLLTAVQHPHWTRPVREWMTWHQHELSSARPLRRGLWLLTLEDA